ncbi:MAG: hypothetical protein Q8Q48_03910 [Candidatus Staskawiczbacteria bacterium]|nr:hypothetical protein [Candidatus Staskawiczbacteria bacterium]
MPKKVYDVIPPKLADKIEKDVKEYLKAEKEHTPIQQKRGRKNRRDGERRSIWLPVSGGVAVLVLIVGVYLFFKLPKADVEIWPKVETLSFQQTITADESADLTDAGQSIIPAKQFEITKTLSEEFPATGNASDEGKATGTITVYNKFDPPTPFTFRVGTRFLSDSGKLFIAPSKVVIPAAKKSGSKITPGSVQIKVEAVEGGDSYNISASNFSVPGLKGTAYYYSVYASSDSAMTGGYVGDIKKVTDDDIQSAKDALIEKLTALATEELRNQISSDYVLPDDAIVAEVSGAGTQTKSGTVADKFTYEATIKLSVLAFKKSDMDELAKKYIISQMSDGKTLLDSSLKTSYSAKSINIDDGTMALDVNFSSGVYKSIDKNSVSMSMGGKNANQINDTITNLLGDELLKTKVSFWPFWVTKTPKNQKAINVELKFE